MHAPLTTHGWLHQSSWVQCKKPQHSISGRHAQLTGISTKPKPCKWTFFSLMGSNMPYYLLYPQVLKLVFNKHWMHGELRILRGGRREFQMEIIYQKLLLSMVLGSCYGAPCYQGWASKVRPGSQGLDLLSNKKPQSRRLPDGWVF